MNYNWNWGVLLQTSFDGQNTYLSLLLIGLRWTLITAACAWTIALTLGTILGTVRAMFPRTCGRLIAVYVEIVRGIPLLVQFFLLYFVLPELVPHEIGVSMKQHPDASFYTAVTGLGIFMSARIAEQVRAGLGALPVGQLHAAYSIGLTKAQAYRYVLLPVAARIVLPPLTSELINTVKNTSVALVVGLPELTSQARSMQEITFQVFEAFTVATVLYLTVNFIGALSMNLLERRLALPGFVSGK